MKYSKLIIIIVFAFCVNSSVFSQSGITVTGATALGNNFSVSYSVGFLKTISSSGTGGEVFQGLQNPLVNSVVSDLNERIAELKISTYPNPVYDILNIKTDADKLKYRLLTSEGKILRENDITNSQTEIKMSGFAPALYILQVTSNSEIVKSFKIFKN